ncbi:conserved Plasmodium protein, unknown function [Plasmodium ovale wallikeri]|uniref:DUF6832 domain-containing protein n=1 Tax=Plasmodium ovale wallikeri TaxID=864142 RepID=A0A1A8YPJ8_PLAOA|nr:conserved Plasmodium protein, unknown function [Plasmodium ovale wallikeri]SBT33977.1 conserved Plasmodium protein, unknown function [Plasmodium ovale wallikeri]
MNASLAKNIVKGVARCRHPFLGKRVYIATESIVKNSFLTKEYYDQGKKRKIDLFDFVPPENFVSSYFEKLDRCYSNPRSILR